MDISLRFRRPRRLTLGLALLTAVLTALPATAVPAAHAATPTGRTWTGDYETGNLTQFGQTSWNDQPAAPVVEKTVVDGGRYAGRYYVPAGGSRCENVPNLGEFHNGDSLWFAWSTRLDSTFPVGINNWQVIDQWKNDGTGSPPVELAVSNGQFVLNGGWGWPGNTDAIQPRLAGKNLGPARTGTWDHWLVHIVFSDNPAVGYVSVRRNGSWIFGGWHMPGGTLYPQLASYWKVGYYRDQAIKVGAAVYQDNFRVGTSWQAVTN